MSNLHREHSIGAAYQISVDLGTRFQRIRFFRNQPIRNKNCLWWPCLLTDRDEMSNLYRGPSIDASYKISDKLVLRFQRRRLKCEKLTDDGCLVNGKSSRCLWQGELKNWSFLEHGYDDRYSLSVPQTKIFKTVQKASIVHQ